MRTQVNKKKTIWFLRNTYIQAIKTYDCIPFPILDTSQIPLALQCCDGMLVPGGYDIEASYQKDCMIDLHTCYETPMDHFDFYCLEHFIKARKPILGICRGIQLINVYFHGTLYSDINIKQHAPKHKHHLRCEPISLYGNIYPSNYEVNSYHHQCIKELGENLQCFAKSADGYCEGIYHTSLPILGVQWHPELLQQDPIFSLFFDVICSNSFITPFKQEIY